MNKEKQKLYKQFEKYIISNKYSDTEEMTEELNYAFEWFYKKIEKYQEDAWKYNDLNK